MARKIPFFKPQYASSGLRDALYGAQSTIREGMSEEEVAAAKRLQAEDAEVEAAEALRIAPRSERKQAEEMYNQYLLSVNHASKAQDEEGMKSRAFRAGQIRDMHTELVRKADNLDSGFEQASFETKLLQERAEASKADFAFDQVAAPDLQIEATEKGAARTAAGELDNRRRRKSSVEADPVLGI